MTLGDLVISFRQREHTGQFHLIDQMDTRKIHHALTKDLTSTEGSQFRELDGILTCNAWDVGDADYVLLAGCIGR